MPVEDDPDLLDLACNDGIVASRDQLQLAPAVLVQGDLVPFDVGSIGRRRPVAEGRQRVEDLGGVGLDALQAQGDGLLPAALLASDRCGADDPPGLAPDAHDGMRGERFGEITGSYACVPHSFWLKICIGVKKYTKTRR